VKALKIDTICGEWRGSLTMGSNKFEIEKFSMSNDFGLGDALKGEVPLLAFVCIKEKEDLIKKIEYYNLLSWKQSS
ncbi:hypothetical protein CR513_18458, partial [Mucuna pruriens]